MITRELFQMVRAEKIEPSKFISFALYILESEKNNLILEVCLSFVLSVLNSYVLFSQQEKYRKQLMNILQDNFYSKFIEIKNTTVNAMLELIDFKNETDMDTLLNFLQKNDNSKKLSLLRGASEIADSLNNYNNLDVSDLTLSTKKNLIQSIYESAYFDLTLKKHLKQIILGGVEIDDYFKYTLDAAIPDKEKKYAIWSKLVYSGNENSKINEAYMAGFARKSQYSLLKNYLKERFFSDFNDMRKNNSQGYAIKFFSHLNPSFIIEDEILEKFSSLRKDLDSDESFKNRIWSENKLISKVDKSKNYT